MHVALLPDHRRRGLAVDMAAGPLAPDHDGIVAGGGAYADHPTSTAVNGDTRAAGTLTNGGTTRAFGLTPRCGRAIAGRARRRAALLRTARGRGAALAVATFGLPALPRWLAPAPAPDGAPASCACASWTLLAAGAGETPAAIPTAVPTPSSIASTLI